MSETTNNDPPPGFENVKPDPTRNNPYNSLTGTREHSSSDEEQQASEEPVQAPSNAWSRKPWQSERVVYGAGVLPYTISQGNVMFLIGQERDRKVDYSWCDFGGMSDYHDFGSKINTAAREFWEETLGCVYDIHTAKINLEKSGILLECLTLGGPPYYLYLLKIPNNSSYPSFFDKTYNFLREMNPRPHKKYLEKSKIRWISRDTLLANVRLQTREDNLKLREIFRQAIQLHIDTLMTLS